MRRTLLFLIIAFACSFAALAQNNQKMDYKKEWKKIDDLNTKKLPQSVLTEVGKVYSTALSEKNYEQALKAVIYRIRALGQVQENTVPTLIDSLKQDAVRLPQPAKSVVYSIIGDMYKGYYQSNRWQIQSRTRAAVVNDDINTWDISRLFEEAIKYYKLSVQDEKILQQTPINNYTEILTDYAKTIQADNTNLLPTLYDFLVFRTIKAFESELSAVLPQQTFVLNKPEYMADVNTFIKLKIETSDTLSVEYQVISLYQKLLKFRVSEYPKSGFALANLDVERLKYVRNYGNYVNKDALYEGALKAARDSFGSSYKWEYPYYALAMLYKEQGAAWRTSKNDAHRTKYKEAYDLCQLLIGNDVESGIKLLAKNLKGEIAAPTTTLTFEPVQYPDSPILALAKYRNSGKLHLFFYKISDVSARDFQTQGRGIKIANFAGKTPFKKQTVEIPLQADYQNYSAEIMIEGLPQGNYVVLVSHTAELGKNLEKEILTETSFQVSPLTMLLRSANSKQFPEVASKSDAIYQAYIANSKTGKPVSKAKVTCYSQRWQSGAKGEPGKYIDVLEGSYYTDDSGVANIPRKTENNIYKSIITSGTDRLVLHNWNSNYWWYGENSQSNRVVFFTDRAIYRPGQTVYYKALYLQHNGGNNKLMANNKLDVSIKDVNYKIISTQQHTTNEYGTIQGSFTIPQGLLNGQMTIETAHGSIGIRVEEYKRPTFEAKFDPVKKNYKLNDNVEVSGSATALAGYAVDNSKVQYRVVRNVQYRTYRWWYPQITEVQREITSGEVTTDSKGAFTINFTAEADDVKNNNLIYDYVVTADITDVNGETRSTNMSVKISNKPLLVSAAIPDRIVSRDVLESVNVLTTNLNGDFTPAAVEISVTELKVPNRILRSRLWAIPDTFALKEADFKKHFPVDAYGDENNPQKFAEGKQVGSYQLQTVAPGAATKSDNVNSINLSKLATASAGWYRIDIKAKNADGIEVDDVKFVQIVGNSSAAPKPTGGSAPIPPEVKASQLKLAPAPIQTMSEWLTVVKNSGEPGENAEFWLAGGENTSYLHYEVLFKNKIVEQKSIVVGTTPERIVIPIKEEHRGGFAVQFVMAQNGRLYWSLNEVNVPYTNKELDITFKTFRDKLLPGEKEKWTLTVKNKKGEKEMAEMVTTLYDASLDVFVPHAWVAGYFYQQRNHYNLTWFQPYYNPLISTYARNLRTTTAYVPQYPVLNMFGYNYNQMIYVRSSSRRNMKDKAIVGAVAMPSSEVVESEFTGDYIKEDDELQEQKVEAGAGGNQQQAPLDEIVTRQNFNETAFFYPQLTTNEQGEIIIEFTIPEALTRWKMLGFAHTKDFKIGTTTNELITQKQVAISANAPRFFREGDVIEFTAKVNNITENELSGQAMLRLYDATNMQPIDAQVVRSPQTADFKVKAGESTGVKWTLAIPAGIQAITYRLTAQAGSHTDGEEKIVPVMVNSMLVTETMPFYIRGGEQKNITFNRLKDNKSNTLRNHSLTLEFTSNPAWYAIQAMPYLMEYPHDCTEQTFSRFYANSLATTVVNSSPRIKQVFDTWRNMPENKDALLSNLEKNQELKQVLLEETPWVMQAQNESERKKRVGVLFDLNKMGGEQQRAFDKLKQAQASNGGFPWFAGLPENRFITQHIVAGIGHLRKLNALDDNFKTDATNISANALAYLDYYIKNDYDDLLKEKGTDLKLQHISTIQLHYLYVCSFSEHKPQNAAQLAAFNYYFKQAAKYWTSFNIYSQAMTALTMKRFGDNETAALIMKSLKERAQQSDEMGMYWKDNVAGYFWYQAPIETQAMLIEAFNEVTNDSKSVEEMKIWLLRNKQTNDWRTTKATAEATYALLMTGKNLLDESKTLDVTIGGKALAQAANDDIRPEPGTGYVKTAWKDSDVTKNMADIVVKNPNTSGMAWGGMYWQYFEQLDKITGAETNLGMVKQLFIKDITERGAELLPLNKSNVLKVGDVVTVRMELRADRDYEYVHLKDMRAASFEPVKAISGYRHQDGLWYYESIKDASTNFFIPYLRKGTYVFEYELRVTHSGQFSNGITTFQCMYTPEFSSHSEGVRVDVK